MTVLFQLQAVNRLIQGAEFPRQLDGDKKRKAGALKGGVMFELLFILGFTLHNIEEAIWLPEWSKYAERFHKRVSRNEFLFAVIIITAIGYLFTFQYLLFKDAYPLSKYLYCGFVLMMVMNVFTPHLLSSIILKRYCPGTATGVLLNLPIGGYILHKNINPVSELYHVLIAFTVITVITLLLIKILFRLGDRLFDY